MQRAAIVLLVLVVFVATVVLWDPAPDSHRSLVPAPTRAPTSSDVAKIEPDRLADESADRTEVAPVGETFTCTNEDGEAIENPVRDGVVIEVRDVDGRPLAKTPIGLYWRKGWGMYGWDRGLTEVDGTFATTAREVPFFENVEVQHPELGGLSAYEVPLPTANDPRRVVYVVPRTAEVRFVARDLGGAPLAGAKLALRASPEPRGLRENVFVPRAAGAARTDAKGRMTAQLPVGIVEVEASVGEERPALEARVRVPPSGGEVDLVLPNPEARHELRITVVRSEEAGALHRVQAWGRSDLPRPRSPLVLGFESQQRDYEVHTAGDGTFTAEVDALPFRISATSAKGWAAGQEVAANQREAQLLLQPRPPFSPPGPMAQIEVTVTGVDGRPASGVDVRLHLTPDLVHGSDHTTDRDGRLVLSSPATGKKACVSARKYQLPFVLAGPVVLREGKQEVKIQLVPGGVIRGHVVNANGEPVKSKVLLRRPAGPLREMEGGGPEILPHSASGDSEGTGEAATFDFDGVGPGVHEVWAFPDSGGLPARALASAGDDVTLRLGEGCDDVHLLEVQVVDADTGDVLPYVHVRVDDSLYTPVRDGERGPFRVAVREGEVEITARAIDHVVQTMKVTTRKGGPTCTVRLEPSPLRFVRIVDEQGLGKWPTEIRAVTETGDAIHFLDEYGNHEGAVVRTDRNGCVVLRGLPRGPCRLVVEDPREGDGKNTVREFELPRGAGLDARHELVWK